MKCDRIYPVCGRCQRTGRADQCTYDPRLLEDLPANGEGQGHGEGGGGPTYEHHHHENPAFGVSGDSHITTDALIWKFRAQERRVGMLERRLANLDDAENPGLPLPPSHLDDFDPHEEEPIVKEEIMFRGKGFKTQFYGSTSPFSLITQVGDSHVKQAGTSLQPRTIC